jgi:hypothetical protein
LNPGDIFGILESDELVEKLADCDEGELPDRDVSSESDFHDEEDDVLLLVTDIVDILELFFYENLIQTVVDEINHYLQQLKNSRRIVTSTP